MPVQSLAYLNDHKGQLALQQEEEALPDTIGGMPGLRIDRERLRSRYAWPSRATLKCLEEIH